MRSVFTQAILCLLMIFSLSACAPVTHPTPDDPLEGFNRRAFAFNETLDKAILKPVAKVYNAVLPDLVTHGIKNFFSNLGELPTIANDLLQFNLYQAISDTWRFAVNSTFGIAGFFDVAKYIGLEYNYEDFGLTLAKWGYKDSPYLVIPFFGPSTVRDAFGRPVDYYLFSAYPHIDPPRYRYALYGLSAVSWRAEALRYQDVLKRAAIDKYVFVRNAYMQHRNYLIKRNENLEDPYDENDPTDIATDEDFEFFDADSMQESPELASPKTKEELMSWLKSRTLVRAEISE